MTEKIGGTPGIGTVDYSEGCSRISVSLMKEDSMGKEKNKQKPNTKKKPQHTLKEKRQAKKEKTEGKPPGFGIM
jgi:ribosomal protein S3